MSINFIAKSGEIYQKVKNTGVKYSALVKDKVAGNKPWSTAGQLVHGGNIYALILPIGTNLGYSAADSELLKKIKLEIMFVTDMTATDIEAVDVNKTIYRLAKSETLQPTGIALLHYGWLS